MPGRFDPIHVTTSRANIAIPWATCEALLAQLRHVDGAAGIVKAFEDAGESRPVSLTPEQRALLFRTLEDWSARVTADELPAGLRDLRSALADDLHDDPPG